jgi:hypothetical protein
MEKIIQNCIHCKGSHEADIFDTDPFVANGMIISAVAICKNTKKPIFITHDITKQKMKTGDLLIFFFAKEDANILNNYQQHAPAIILTAWKNSPEDQYIPVMNLSVLTNSGVQVKTSVQRAETLEEAAAGNRWATREQCELWAINLDCGYNDLDKLLENSKAKEIENFSKAEDERLPAPND